MRQRLLSIVAAVAALTATGIVAVPRAEAAGPGEGRISRAEESTGSVVTLSAGGIEILCRVSIDQPRHIPEFAAVTGQARVLCNYFVPKLVLYVELTRDNVELPGSTSQDVQQDTLTAGATAAAPCVSGFYYASALIFVTFPLGVVPPSASALYDGDGISIQC